MQRDYYYKYYVREFILKAREKLFDKYKIQIENDSDDDIIELKNHFNYIEDELPKFYFLHIVFQNLYRIKLFRNFFLNINLDNFKIAKCDTYGNIIKLKEFCIAKKIQDLFKEITKVLNSKGVINISKFYKNYFTGTDLD